MSSPIGRKSIQSFPLSSFKGPRYRPPSNKDPDEEEADSSPSRSASPHGSPKDATASLSTSLRRFKGPTSPTSRASVADVDQLVLTLARKAGESRSEREAAAKQLGKLAAEGGADIQEAVLLAGGVAPLVALLGGNEALATRREAAAALTRLIRGHRDSQDAYGAAGAIPMLVELLGFDLKHRQVYDVEARRVAALALGRLAEGHLANKRRIIQAEGVRALVKLARAQEALKAQRATLFALEQFIDFEDCKHSLTRADGISLFVALVMDPRPTECEEIRESATNILKALAAEHEERQRLIQTLGGKEFLASLLGKGPPHVR